MYFYIKLLYDYNRAYLLLDGNTAISLRLLLLLVSTHIQEAETGYFQSVDFQSDDFFRDVDDIVNPLPGLVGKSGTTYIQSG